MVFRGTIQGNTVKLDGPTGLPDGTEVDVQPAKGRPRAKKKPGSVHAWLKSLAFDAGPSDMSEQVDHYVYGLPKRKMSKAPARRPRKKSASKRAK